MNYGARCAVWTVALVLALAHVSGSVEAAVGFDLAWTKVGTADSIDSWTHTVSGNDRILLVSVTVEDEVVTGVSGVTYNGVPLTKLDSVDGNGKVAMDLWFLVDPDPGANLVTVDMSGGNGEFYGAGSMSFTGVDPFQPLGTSVKNSGNDDTPTVDVSSAAGELVVDTVANPVAIPTSSPDQTTRFLAAIEVFSGGSTEPGAPTVTMSWSLPSNKDWAILAVPLKPTAPAILGKVFEDADFAGTAAAYDGGIQDRALQGVDVELYDAGTDNYITSTVTAADGSYFFAGLADGSYKVRARSATIGTGAATPLGGLNGTVPGTWPYPLPEMTWGNGLPIYGGQSAAIDDTATADDGGPGDTWVPVTIAGAAVTGVDLGFAYNLIVNTTDDGSADGVRSTQGSLRQFVKNANAIGAAGGTSANSSQFRIPGAGPHTIQPASALPAIDDPITLDGYTQPGAAANTVPAPGVTDAVLLIELDGSLAGAGVHGLHCTGSGSTIRGLVINRFTLDGIRLAAFGANTVEGNYIGTDIAGAVARANAGTGVYLTSSSNTIGGASPDARNVISGNTGFGVKCSGSSKTNNSILGNYIGIVAGGTAALTNNDHAVEMSDCPSNVIGAIGAGNVINARFGRYGIAVISGTATGNEIRANKIGTNAAGDARLSGGTTGINISSGGSTTIGSTAPGAGNVIGGYFQAGISTNGSATVIEGNYIGTDPSGTLDLTTGSVGVRIQTGGTAVRIGGTVAGAENVIAFNADSGVQLQINAAAQNQISRNRIYSNGALGIDLQADGVTTNDLNDADPGPNDLQNFPVLDTVLIDANFAVTGWSRPGDVIEVFIAAAHPSGFGEGETWVVTLTEGGTGAGGEDSYPDLDATSSSYGPGPVNGIVQGEDTTDRFSFSLPVPAGVSIGTQLTATARDGLGSTSEFSGLVTVLSAADLIVGNVFEDVNYGGGPGRDRATAAAAAPSFSVGRPLAVVELYDAAGNFLQTTTTDAAGQFGFAALVDGDYQVRVVNETVVSSRPGATATEWPVQTFRTDASSGVALPVVVAVGGADTTAQDSGPNVAMASLSSITAQSVAPVRIQSGVAVTDVDFGFNFSTVVNTNDVGQGSLRQFVLNSNNLN